MRWQTWLAAACCIGLQGKLARAQEGPEPPGEAPIYPGGPVYPEPGKPTRLPLRDQLPPGGPFSLSVNQKYTLKLDLLIEVPIPLTEDHDSVSPGFGLAAMFGWDLGFLLPTANIGWSWTGLDIPGWYGDRSLTRFHFGVGVMAEFDNRSPVTPVFGALVDLNWWHVSGDVTVVCDGYYYWGCYRVADYDYTTGFTFRAGLDFGFPRNDRFSLGTGILPWVTLSGGPFRDPEWWLSPYATFTVRN